MNFYYRIIVETLSIVVDPLKYICYVMLQISFMVRDIGCDSA